jgi:glutamyl-tRNA reductase
LRGRFTFAIEQIEPTLLALRRSLSRAPEAALISTCNRTELYAWVDSDDPTVVAADPITGAG